MIEKRISRITEFYLCCMNCVEITIHRLISSLNQLIDCFSVCREDWRAGPPTDFDFLFRIRLRWRETASLLSFLLWVLTRDFYCLAHSFPFFSSQLFLWSILPRPQSFPPPFPLPPPTFKNDQTSIVSVQVGKRGDFETERALKINEPFFPLLFRWLIYCKYNDLCRDF